MQTKGQKGSNQGRFANVAARGQTGNSGLAQREADLQHQIAMIQAMQDQFQLCSLNGVNGQKGTVGARQGQPGRNTQSHQSYQRAQAIPFPQQFNKMQPENFNLVKANAAKSLDRVGSQKEHELSEMNMQINVDKTGIFDIQDIENPKLFNNTMQLANQTQTTKKAAAKKFKLGFEPANASLENDTQKPVLISPRHLQMAAEQNASFLKNTEQMLLNPSDCSQAPSSTQFTGSSPKNTRHGNPQVKMQTISQQQSQQKKVGKSSTAAMKRKPSIQNSKKVIQPQCKQPPAFNSELMTINNMMGQIQMHSNYTTKNAHNQISTNYYREFIAKRVNLKGNGTTQNSNANSQSINLNTQTYNDKGSNEFNCLINSSQNYKPAQALEKQPQGLPPDAKSKVIGRVQSGKPQNIKRSKVQVKNPSNPKKFSSQLQVQQQISATSNNSLMRFPISKSKENTQDSIEIGSTCNSNFNNTQNISVVKQALMDQKVESQEALAPAMNAQKKGQGNQRKFFQQTHQYLQKKQEVMNKHLNLENPQFNHTLAGVGNIGSFIFQNDGQITQQNQAHPDKLFGQVYGSSSATNKVKKQFDFDFEQQMKQKRERKQGVSTQATNMKKPIQFAKGAAQNPGAKNIGGIKKIQVHKQFNEANKAKLEMNLTGPLPKNILSPKNATNKSSSKTKHSQYFNNSSEIIPQQQKYSNQIQMDQQAMQYAAQQNVGNNGSLNSQQQHFQVQLNSIRNEDQKERHQITTTTQGCNTVININIDSNTWGRQNRREQKEGSAMSRNEKGSYPTEQSQPENGNRFKAINKNEMSIKKPMSNMKRQSSSKMRSNESVSSQKSRQYINHRSSSGSQMKNQMVPRGQVQQLSSLNYNLQPLYIQKTPQSNADIIMNNIQKINEKLHYQENQSQLNGPREEQEQKLLININNIEAMKPTNLLNQSAKMQFVNQNNPRFHDNFAAGPQYSNQSTLIQNPKVGSLSPHEQRHFQVIPQKHTKETLKMYQSSQPQGKGHQKIVLKKVQPHHEGSKATLKNSSRAQGGGIQNHQQQPQSRFYSTNKGHMAIQNEQVNAEKQNEAMMQHLMNIETQIKQNQIRLRNELEQMQNMKIYQPADEMLIDDTVKVDAFQGEGQSNQPGGFIEETHLEAHTINDSVQKRQKEHAKSAGKHGNGVRVSNPRVQHQIPRNPQKIRGNRSTGTSSQGRNKHKNSKMKEHRVNLEDIRLDFDGQSHASGFNSAFNCIQSKKAMSTKHQNGPQKLNTQNVQSLLREAKREMIIDLQELDQIQVGGDDLTMKNQNRKKMNFNGTQNVAIGQFSNNLFVNPQPKGFSPANRFSGQVIDERAFNTQAAKHPPTFGLGQMKNKISNSAMKQGQVQPQFQKLQTKHGAVENKNESQNQPAQRISQKAPVGYQVERPQGGEVQHPSMSGTMNSQMSDSQITKRNSNLPPNSASKLAVEISEENLLANSHISENELIVEQPASSHTNALNSDSTRPDALKSDQILELPTTGAKVFKHFLKRAGITEYEKTEILDYKQVFFLGLGSEKIKGSKHHQFNSGYDDERGDYNIVLRDHISYRFEVLDFLGKGSFGQALKCKDHKTGEIVAIKIIRNKKKFQHQAGVELKILLHLSENDPEDTNNIIRIKDYCMFRSHLIISFELFSINLYEFIKNNNFEGVSLSLIRRFAIQILQALKYLSEEKLIHCDLKPENILLKSPDKSGLKVIDFGSSCFQHEKIYTYIQSRFYRAPEIILGIPYTAAIDMWSFGCILTELFTGVPIFPGESEQEQLSLIMEVCGLPSEHILQQSTRKKVFFDDHTNEPHLTKDSNDNLRIPGSKPLQNVLMCDSDSFLDFIGRCLELDPEKRITPFEALMHEWIIEGLPPQVLVHHKKMLGIYESENEQEQQQQSHDQLEIEGDPEFQNHSNEFDFQNVERFQHESQFSQIQMADDKENDSSYLENVNHQLNFNQNESCFEDPDSQMNQINEAFPSEMKPIDFYNQHHMDASPSKAIEDHKYDKIICSNEYMTENAQLNLQSDYVGMDTYVQYAKRMRNKPEVEQLPSQNSKPKNNLLVTETTKYKTTNMSDILSQINKKQGSSKNKGPNLRVQHPNDVIYTGGMQIQNSGYSHLSQTTKFNQGKGKSAHCHLIPNSGNKQMMEIDEITSGGPNYILYGEGKNLINMDTEDEQI